MERLSFINRSAELTSLAYMRQYKWWQSAAIQMNTFIFKYYQIKCQLNISDSTFSLCALSQFALSMLMALRCAVCVAFLSTLVGFNMTRHDMTSHLEIDLFIIYLLYISRLAISIHTSANGTTINTIVLPLSFPLHIHCYVRSITFRTTHISMSCNLSCVLYLITLNVLISSQ